MIKLQALNDIGTDVALLLYMNIVKNKILNILLNIITINMLLLKLINIVNSIYVYILFIKTMILLYNT